LPKNSMSLEALAILFFCAACAEPVEGSGKGLAEDWIRFRIASISRSNFFSVMAFFLIFLLYALCAMPYAVFPLRIFFFCHDDKFVKVLFQSLKRSRITVFEKRNQIPHEIQKYLRPISLLNPSKDFISFSDILK